VSQAELIADLGVLIRMWHGILEQYKHAPAPSLIHKDMNLVYKAARDFITPQVDRVLIDDPEEYEKVRDFLRLLGPQYVERIQLYNHGRSLFKDYKIDDEVQRLLRPKINLPSGGSIVIESTEALTVIDVNSGKFTGGKNLEDTIVKTNIEAAAEIARQVRLRDIGGIIVCDFIDMSTEGARNKVLTTLENGLRRDRTRTTIQSFSALGLLEFTRKRIGKDLSGQLRGKCPTCEGLGTVMSPESVAIEAFRDVRKIGHDHRNGKTEKRMIDVTSAPLVGAQIEFWYETELQALEQETGAKIDIHVDPALHPERVKIAPADPKTPPAPPHVRVGDEIEVDLLQTRLPNPTSALAVVDRRLVEVENAAPLAGQTIKIKVIDIDEEGYILAEPRAAVVADLGERKRRRRRGGARGRQKELTPAEQAEELRELAEEAAKGLEERPPLGISTGSEPDVEDAEARARAAALRASQAQVPGQPGHGVVRLPNNVVPLESATGAGGEEGTVRRRRRRRRRRRPGAGDAATGTGIAQHSFAPPADDEEAIEGEGPETAPAVSAAATTVPLAAASYGGREEGGGHRRRRRRRRRGRGQLVLTPETQAVPERHIFRGNADGSLEATGETAPPEPSRAIAAVRQETAAVAVEPPPPSLTVAPEPPRIARPARRRRGAVENDDVSIAVAALPPPAAEPAASPADVPAPKRTRTRKAAVTAENAEPTEEAKPKRARRTATAAAKTKTTKAPKSATTSATKKSSAKKTTTRKVSTRKKKT
ncbi:MAG TPA: ribonuclease E/G, partial [Candidatus Acidoferrales bacterium]|nr:ribonuclease E/G [Candidatus Acidoferrales bacterium]